MRDLTKKEIDAKPEWATHFLVCHDNDVCFQNDDFHYFLNDENLAGLKLVSENGIYYGSKKIPSK